MTDSDAYDYMVQKIRDGFNISYIGHSRPGMRLSLRPRQRFSHIAVDYVSGHTMSGDSDMERAGRKLDFEAFPENLELARASGNVLTSEACRKQTGRRQSGRWPTCSAT